MQYRRKYKHCPSNLQDEKKGLLKDNFEILMNCLTSQKNSKNNLSEFFYFLLGMKNYPLILEKNRPIPKNHRFVCLYIQINAGIIKFSSKKCI